MSATLMKRWFLLLLALLLVAAACGSSDDSGAAVATTPSNEFDRQAPAGGDDGAFIAGDDTTGVTSAASEAGQDATAQNDSGIGSGGIEPVVQPTDLGRDIIFTAEVTVAVTNVAEAGEEATNAMEALGGFLFGQQTNGGPNPRSVLTFKVVPENFQEALTRLGSIGELRTQNVSTDDVTERVVDLESRISTAAASVERLRGFLDQATEIVTITELEAQLLDRETTLETLRGTLRTIRRQVDLATIFLTLTEAQSQPQLSVSVTAYPGDEDAGASCPGTLDMGVEQGEAVTICYELFNTGDINLTDFTFRDPVLGVELDDLILVFGDLTSPMEPGQTIVLATEVKPERNLRTSTRITATPINADAVKVVGRDVSSSSTFFVVARDPGGLPGFLDSAEATLAFLTTLAGLLLVLAGGLLPVLPLLGGWWVYRLWRRRQDDVGTEQEANDPQAGSTETLAATPADSPESGNARGGADDA